jgi:integration host factor subunit beta
MKTSMAKASHGSVRALLPVRDRMSVLLEKDMVNERDIDRSIQEILSIMIDSLSEGKRIELRGFGTFDLSYRAAHLARNPKTGVVSMVPDRYIPRFRAGKKLKMQVDYSEEDTQES